MGMAHYLAMTAAELGRSGALPEKIAWMACHFSPYGLGLSNLPQSLPEGSLLILDDITPIRDHDPVLIGEQLAHWVGALNCSGVLLDFQRPGYSQYADLAGHLSEVLPCPVAVSELYANGNHAAVFLPPVPCHLRPRDHFAPWHGRDIWLEAALNGETLTVTEDGCRAVSLPKTDFPEAGFADARLHCHYRIQAQGQSLIFSLWRTGEDLAALLEEAADCHVVQTIGLYQDLE